MATVTRTVGHIDQFMRRLPIVRAFPRDVETYVVLTLMAAAFGIRVWHAATSPMHEDEYYQAWAAATVAQTLTPRLPSDALYTHGITITYLAAPLYALFDFNPFALRLPSAILGAATVGLAYGWTRRIGGPVAAVIAAIFIGFEPHMVMWGSRIRMYQILVLLVLATGYGTWRGFIAQDSQRWKTASGGLAALAVLTHFTGIAFLIVPTSIVAWNAIARRRLTRDHVLWGAFAGGAVLFETLHRLMTPSAILEASSTDTPTFALPVQPTFDATDTLLHAGTWLHDLSTQAHTIPILIAIGLLVPAALNRKQNSLMQQAAYPLLLALVPLISITILSPASLATPRYTLAAVGMLAPVIGCTFALSIQSLTSQASIAIRRTANGGLIGIMVCAMTIGLVSFPTDISADLHTAYAYVAENQGPDAAIVAQHPPITAMMTGQFGHYLIPGLPTPEVRVKDGRYVDPWIGSPLAFREFEICQLLASHERVWIIALGGQLSRLEPEAKDLILNRFQVLYAEEDAGNPFGRNIRVLEGHGPCHPAHTTPT